jgi:3-hydroxy-9,10-secoandrosta-1,3,5(10)-triene-9,17-dione monooxygenase
MSVIEKSTTLSHVIPTEAELLQRATDLLPCLRERASACEKERMVPPETIADFEAAGFFHIVRPKAWGGYEMSPTVFYRVLQEIGRGCPSSAWVLMVIGIHTWEMGLFDPKAVDDLWAKDPLARTSSSYHPWGKGEKVKGGYRLNGTWRFSSGCDHCSWALLGVIIKDGDKVDQRVMLVPRTDYQIDDNWYVFGLNGSGSKDIVVKDVFVPEHRSHSVIDCHLMTHVNELAPRFRTSFGNTFCFAVASVLIGIAQGAIDVFTEQMKVRVDTLTGGKSNLSPYVRDRLGRAQSNVRGARARLMQSMQEMEAMIEQGITIPLEKRVDYKSDATRIGRDCEEAVISLYKSTAARGTFLSNPIQRFLRDALVAANHITLNADDSMGNLGGVLLGAECTDGLL